MVQKFWNAFHLKSTEMSRKAYEHTNIYGNFANELKSSILNYAVYWM